MEAFCESKGIPCFAVNPRITPHLREVMGNRSKADKSDAELLWLYGKQHGEGHQLHCDPLAKVVSACLTCCRVIQKARIAFQGVVEALEQDPVTPEEVLRELRQEIAKLEEKETRYRDRIRDLAAGDEGAFPALEGLLSIPGVGPITAFTLLCFRNYPGANRGQIVALAGLDPVEFQSGVLVQGRQGSESGTGSEKAAV